MSGTSIWTTNGLITAYHGTEVKIEPFRAPDGITWVSQGAYEQSLKLQAALQRISELESELADHRFPIKGMSGVFDETNGMDVWRTSCTKTNSLNFRKAECFFCDETKPCLYMKDDFGEMGVCLSCLAKMFDVFCEKMGS